VERETACGHKQKVEGVLKLGDLNEVVKKWFNGRKKKYNKHEKSDISVRPGAPGLRQRNRRQKCLTRGGETVQKVIEPKSKTLEAKHELITRA